MRVRLIKDLQFGQDGPRINTDGTVFNSFKVNGSLVYTVIYDGFDADGVFYSPADIVEVLDD